MKNCIVILGTHRSGTSALMGALQKCGVHIGTSWLENLYEHPSIVKMHDEMLSNLNSAWDQTFLLEEHWWTVKKVKKYRKKIIEIIKHDFKEAQWWGIKDPRMCVLIPLWIEIFNELSITPYFVISVRNPIEIAKSHERRDHFSLEKSLLIWMEHLLSAEYHTRRYQRVFSNYAHLIANPMETISNITMGLNIQLPMTVSEASENLKAFIRPDLKHHNLAEKIDDSSLPIIIDELNQLLLKCCENMHPPHSAMESFDNIRAEFTKMKRFLLNSDLKKKFSKLRAIKMQSVEAALEISKFGRDFMATRKFKDGKKLYENLIQIIPKNYVFWNNLGIALENMDEIEKAVDCFKKALDINQQYSYALENLQRLEEQSLYKSEQTSGQ